MYLKSIIISNFKNHTSRKFDFSQKSICIYGKNGSGKTNLLDAIYTLSVSKSFLNHIDNQLINLHSDFFRLEAYFSNKNEENLKIVLKFKPRSKIIEINDQRLPKSNELFGKVPLVVCSPKDIDLIIGGSEERRKWMDYSLCIADRTYLEKLLQYNQIMDQRNALLKSEFPENSLEIFEYYDSQLDTLGSFIYQKRVGYTSEIFSIAQKYYQALSNSREEISMQYSSHLHLLPLLQLLKENFQKDCILKRTSCGIHRDDILMELAGIEFKKSGSQGQQKSMLYAWKLAQAEWISDKLGQKIIFLLDDFSDKLDNQRMLNLQNIINQTTFVSQWFITDTSPLFFEQLSDSEYIHIQ